MKKIFLSMLFAALLTGTAARAEVIGEVLSTDIGTLIDWEPIKSYNINDYTYIKAEDLRNYGFKVEWNEEARTLSISRDYNAEEKICLSEDEINIKKADVPFRQHVYDVYSTDIKTYLNGNEITACNVDGETLIQSDYLQEYGTYTYNDEERMVYIDITASELNKALENAVNPQELKSTPDVYSTSVYTGEAADEKQNGIGKTVYHRAVPDGFMDTTDEITVGYYKDGVQSGKSYSEKTVDTRGGSSPGLFIEKKYASYKDGILNGLVKVRSMDYARNSHIFSEGYYKDDVRNGETRTSEIDSTYLYGFKVTDRRVLDADGDVINYVPYENNSPFVKIYHCNAAGAFRVEKADGTLYTVGNGISKVFVRVDTLPDEISTTADIDDVKKIANGMEELGESGDRGGRLLLLTNGNDVWQERRNYEFEGGEWIDGLDLSKPVKVFSGAKDIFCKDACYFVIDNNDDLWYWNSDYYNREKTGKEVPYSGINVTEPQKICDNVKYVTAGNDSFYAIKNDGSLWVKGNNKYGQLGTGKENDETDFVKILDGVADVISRDIGAMALKENGTLWAWGTDDGFLGIGKNGKYLSPVQITEVYNLK